MVVDNFGEAFGYLWVVPVAIAFYTHTAPKKVNAMMVGVYYLSIFAGSLISGRLGGLYETLSPTAFWVLHAGIVAAAGAIFAGLALSGVAGRFAPEHALQDGVGFRSLSVGGCLMPGGSAFHAPSARTSPDD